MFLYFIGRATIERHTGHQVQAVNRNSTPIPPPPPPAHSDAAIRNHLNREMRITSNPLNLNYADPEDAIKSDHANGNVIATSFDNPNHIELPSQNNIERRERSASSGSRIIDTATYTKKDRISRPIRYTGPENSKSWQ